MRKKLILKPAVLDFDFPDEEALPTSSAGSRLEVVRKRVRRESSTGGGPTADMSIVEVDHPGPMETMPSSTHGKGATLPSGRLVSWCYSWAFDNHPP